MSDPRVTPLALERSRSQLPVSHYFDADVHQRELDRLFRGGPRYLGHALAVPEVGDFHTLLQEGEGRALVRTDGGIELVSNVCRHRQALMLRGRGHTGDHIVCPLHRWTYDLRGRLVGVLNLYFADPQDLHPLAFERATAIADHAAIVIGTRELEQRADNLQVALQNSRTIGAAIGILVERRKITREAAFETLRTRSQQLNRKLFLVAEELVSTGCID